MKDKQVQVYTVSTRFEAESIRILLQSFGIEAFVMQESVAATLGLTVGPLARIRIMVNRGQAKDAREILRSMDKGELATTSNGDEEEN